MSIEPVDTAILSMIPESDPDLTTYLNKILRTKEPEQQGNNFCFPTPKISGKIEDHTPVKTLTLKKLYELKEKEKVNPKDNTESRTKFLEQFD